MILIPSNGDRHKSRSSCLAVIAGRIKERGWIVRGGKEGGGREERGMGNNFTWSNWLRFIIYDLGNNPLRDGKERETVNQGDEGEGRRGIPGQGMEAGWKRGDRAREEGKGGKVYANEKRER